MIMVRGGRSMVRSMWVTSAIAEGPRAAKNGTLVTESQVLRKLSRRVSVAKPVARIPVHSPNTPRPQIITSAATSRPSGVTGTTSPYPTVVSVTTAHHSVDGRLPNTAGCTLRSSAYSATDANTSNIKNSTSTLSSDPDSSTSTLRRRRSPETSGTSLNSQTTPNSHADLTSAPPAMASGTASTATASTSPGPESA